MANGDDLRIAKAARLLRADQGMKRTDLVAPGRSRHFGRRLESGEAGRLRVDDIREHFDKLGARLKISVWWNGAAIDRLFDKQHAELVELAITSLRRCCWHVETEITFSEYGERGSIDFLGGFEPFGAALIGEVKSEWGSMEETLRTLDVKTRLAPKIVTGALGFKPSTIARVLVLPEERTARRIAQRHAETLKVALPHRNREIKRWLREPSGPLRGLWFLSKVQPEGRDSPDS